MNVEECRPMDARQIDALVREAKAERDRQLHAVIIGAAARVARLVRAVTRRCATSARRAG